MRYGAEQLLEALGRLVAAKPRRTVVLTLAAGVLGIVLFLGADLDQDITALFPRGDRHVAALKALHATHAGTNFALVVLTVPDSDPETLKEAADRLGNRLRALPVVDRVVWRISEEEKAFYRESFLANGFLFLPPDALEQALEKLSPEGMEREAAECERLLLSPLPGAEERIVQDPLNLFEDVFLPVMKRRTRGARIDLETGHTLIAARRAALLQVFGKESPRDVKYARRFTAGLRGAVDGLYADGRFSRDRLRVGITGGYPVAVENERSVKRNLAVSCLGAFFGVLLLFMAVFRSLRVNVTVGLPLAVGVSAAFGAAAVALGFHMTAI
ncbi:MAG: MMPL family transporter, partial [Planctomycetota bacterium]